MSAVSESTPVTESAADFIRLINEKLPTIKCVVCGNPTFGLADKPAEGLLTRENLYQKDNPLPAEGVDSVTIACRNCGFVHKFLLQFLRNAKTSTST